MHKIREKLYIGKYAETRDNAFLKAHQFDAVLQLADNIHHPDITTKYVPMEDGHPFTCDQLNDALQFIHTERTKNSKIVIACGAGISRSTTIMMAVLMEEENLELFEAYAHVYDHHPDAMPHFQLILSLAACHGIDMDLKQVIDGLYEVQRNT